MLISVPLFDDSATMEDSRAMKDDSESQDVSFEAELRLPWWKRPTTWLSGGLALLLIIFASGYYFLTALNASSTAGAITAVDYVQSIAFSPDGRLLVAGVDHDDTDGAFAGSSVLLWDVASGKKLRTLSGQENINAVAFSPDGQVVAICSEDENILLWNVASGTTLSTRFANSKAVFSIAFSPNGRLLASGDDDGMVRLWDVASGRLLATFPASSSVSGGTTVTFSPDGRFLAAGSTTVDVWDVASGQLVSPFPDTSNLATVNALSFSPHGDVLALSAETLVNGSTQQIALWNVTDNGTAKPRTLASQDGLIYSLSISPDGRMLAAAADPGIIERWNLTTGKKLPDIQGADELVVAFDPIGHLLASGGGDYNSNPDVDSAPPPRAYVELWDAATGKQVRILT
ncbi:MAG TPA: WD40 repeat domain-containing protein [Ktedonobacteraceae bacterium]|nr:WD40 repeat domain-containing protein [Ktedonobacteraceae bacterium]